MKEDNLPIRKPIEYTQRKIIKRFTLRKLIEDFLDAWNFETGFLRNIRYLLFKPGVITRGYLGEKRYELYSPFRLLFITTAISVFLTVQFDINHNIMESFTEGFNEGRGRDTLDVSVMEELLNEYYSFIIWSTIPIYSLFVFLFLRRKFNYLEHFILFIFFTSAINLIYIILIPLFYFFSSISLYIYLVITIAYLLIFFKQSLLLNKWYHYIILLIAYVIGNFAYIAVLSIATAFFLLQNNYIQ